MLSVAHSAAAMLGVGLVRVSRSAFTGTRFAKTHEYVTAEGGSTARVGISDYAQHALGDLVFVELPAVGATRKQGETLSVVESVKSVSDVYAPVGCEVLEVNKKLTQDPTLLNKDPENKGWIARVKLTRLDEFESLLDADAYKAHCAKEAAAHH